MQRHLNQGENDLRPVEDALRTSKDTLRVAAILKVRTNRLHNGVDQFPRCLEQKKTNRDGANVFVT